MFLGIFVAVQYYSNRQNTKQTVSNDVLAVEIEKIAKTNSELKLQVADLTKKNQSYIESLDNQTELEAQMGSESRDLSVINGEKEVTGQGINMSIVDKISEAQLVDLVNSIKNIGVDGLSINNNRISLYQSFDLNQFSAPYKISMIGNSNLLESALNRKGGVIELMKQKGISVAIEKSDSITLPVARSIDFKYAKIVEKN